MGRGGGCLHATSAVGEFAGVVAFGVRVGRCVAVLRGMVPPVLIKWTEQAASQPPGLLSVPSCCGWQMSAR